MVKDAEAHAAEDKKRREAVEAKNHAEALVAFDREDAGRAWRQGRRGRPQRDRERPSPTSRRRCKGEDAEAIKAKTNDAGAGVDEARRGDVQGQQASGAPGDGGADGGGEAKDDVIDAEFTRSRRRQEEVVLNERGRPLPSGRPSSRGRRNGERIVRLTSSGAARTPGSMSESRLTRTEAAWTSRSETCIG